MYKSSSAIRIRSPIVVFKLAPVTVFISFPSSTCTWSIVSHKGFIFLQCQNLGCGQKYLTIGDNRRKKIGDLIGDINYRRFKFHNRIEISNGDNWRYYLFSAAIFGRHLSPFTISFGCKIVNGDNWRYYLFLAGIFGRHFRPPFIAVYNIIWL